MEKILVIQTAFIGDAILTLPMIQKLKEFFPVSQIDMVAIPSTQEIFSASPFINSVLVLDKRKKHKSFIEFMKFIGEIKKINYTRIYSPHRSFRSSLISRLSGVKETYGFNISSFKLAYKHLVLYRKDYHEVQRNLSLIGFDPGDDTWKILPQVVIPEHDRVVVREFTSAENKSNRFIALAPGSVWNTKKYPKEYFIKIISGLVNKKYPVVLIGGDKDISLCEELRAGNENEVISLAGRFSLIQTIELLKYCSLLISNDSAPSHLGMCADIPVLTIYCSTIAEFGFYPYNRKSSYISYNRLYCKPCGVHGYMKCPINTFSCAYSLTPQVVADRIEEMLNAD